MTSIKEIEVEVTIAGTNYSMNIEMTAELSVDSFSHEFGIGTTQGIEIVEFSIQDAYNNTSDEQVLNDDLEAIQYLFAKNFDVNDYTDNFENDDFL